MAVTIGFVKQLFAVLSGEVLIGLNFYNLEF